MRSAIVFRLILFFLFNYMKMLTISLQPQTVQQLQEPPVIPSLDYTMEDAYDKNQRPTAGGLLTNVSIGLFINRISAVDENNEEISFDVFLQVIWEDKRLRPRNESIFNTTTKSSASSQSSVKYFLELQIEERHKIWVPDLYIRQLREMRLLKLFEEISSLRLYQNSTVALSIGATIIIKCDMDFVLYPLDVQKCPVDFSSYKYSSEDMIFRWKTGQAITFPNDFNEGFFRLPKYVVSFTTEHQPHIVNFGDADHASARLEITLSREVKSYLLENYLPSTLFVSMSWGSFVVVPEVVPGRMVLLVTTLLSLITMFDTVRNNSPDALELKCLEVWLISCTLFVFLALMEYFIVLFGIRYDKHWRTSKGITSLASAPINLAASGMSSETPLTSLPSQRRNGIEHAAKMFNLNKVNPEGRNRDIPVVRTTADTLRPPSTQHQQSTSASLQQQQEDSSGTTSSDNPINRKRFRNVAEYALLYAGSQRGKLDQISLVLFPLSFLVFAIVYWVLYLSESRKIK